MVVPVLASQIFTVLYLVQTHDTFSGMDKWSS